MPAPPVERSTQAAWLSSDEPPPPNCLQRLLCLLWHVTGAAELRGRRSKFPLEHAVERRFRRIADVGRDLADVRIGRRQYFCSQLESPPCQIRHGRLAQKVTKVLSESRA